MLDLVRNPILKGALAGLLSAALVDFAAFRSWQSLHDATSYAWSTALFRWGQGAVVGAVTSAGIGAV